MEIQREKREKRKTVREREIERWGDKAIDMLNGVQSLATQEYLVEHKVK